MKEQNPYVVKLHRIKAQSRFLEIDPAPEFHTLKFVYNQGTYFIHILLIYYVFILFISCFSKLFIAWSGFWSAKLYLQQYLQYGL